MLALLLVAVSLGLANFASSVGIGVSGIDARTRLRVAVIFGVFETGMPILGLLLGHGLAKALGACNRDFSDSLSSAVACSTVRDCDGRPSCPRGVSTRAETFPRTRSWPSA